MTYRNFYFHGCAEEGDAFFGAELIVPDELVVDHTAPHELQEEE